MQRLKGRILRFYILVDLRFAMIKQQRLQKDFSLFGLQNTLDKLQKVCYNTHSSKEQDKINKEVML